MIDTFTIRQKVSGELFSYLKDIKFDTYLKELRNKEDYDQSFKGIQHISLKIFKKSKEESEEISFFHYLDITISPANFISKKDADKLAIFKSEYYKPILAIFEGTIRDYLLLCDLATVCEYDILGQPREQIPPADIESILDFNNYYFKRVDYCCQLPSCRDAEKYIKLLQLGDIQQQGKPKYKYFKIDGELPEGSFYVYANGYHINFYSKQNQLINRGADKGTIKRAENVVRLEIQCARDKLGQIKRKHQEELKKYVEELYKDDANVTSYEMKTMLDYEINNMKSEIELFFDIERAKDIILKAYNNICRKGNYYKKATVIRIIKDNKKRTTQAKMLELLKLVNPSNGKKRAIREVREQLKDKKIKSIIKPEEITKILNWFDDLNINVVCLEDSYKYDMLPNLSSEIEDNFFLW